MLRVAKRPIYSIANEVAMKWKDLGPTVKQCLDVMLHMTNVGDNYGQESGLLATQELIILLDLWKNKSAGRIQRELREHVNVYLERTQGKKI
jgi:hypothetical protein